MLKSVPTYSVTKVVTTIKSITAREIFLLCPHVKKQLWGGEFWTDGYFSSAALKGASTVGKHGDETKIGNYVKNQGKNYKQIYEDRQLTLF